MQRLRWKAELAIYCNRKTQVDSSKAEICTLMKSHCQDSSNYDKYCYSEIRLSPQLYFPLKTKELME